MSLDNSRSNANRFISAFNSIEGFLFHKIENDKRNSFSTMIDLVGKSDNMVRVYANDLKQFASLRNVIVHTWENNKIIAEPNDWCVNRIEFICNSLRSPTKIIPKFSCDVLKMNINKSIGEAAAVMYSKNYSQIPVYDGSIFTNLLTTNTIARWLGAVVEDDVFSLKETLIIDVLPYSELPPSFIFMKRSMNIFDVIETFTEYAKNAIKLDVILITENGDKDEKLLGIITVFDIIEIQKLL